MDHRQATHNSDITSPETDQEFFNWFIRQIISDPHCKTCHGRGYTGIVRVPKRDKRAQDYPLLQLCHCTKLEDTTLQQILTGVNTIGEAMRQHNSAIGMFNTFLSAKLETIDRHTAGYWIDRTATKCIEGFNELKNWILKMMKVKRS